MDFATTLLALTLASGSPVVQDEFMPASSLPDLSGMAWLGKDTFLAVHDAKNPDELDRPRVSLLKLPSDLDGLLWLPLTIDDWPDDASNDLESVARIPGTNQVLLVESGDNDDPVFQRIFRARVRGTRLSIEAVAPWPVDVYNVEASAVARNGNTFVFLYAERAESSPATKIRWAVFDPVTLTFGKFHAVTFRNPDPQRTNRPVVAMDVDRNGEIYTAAAFDAEAAGLPDPDNGPFASSVWLVGKVNYGRRGPKVVLFDAPKRMATLDGLKVESVSVRKQHGERPELFVGLDDENYGATVRRLPAPVRND